MSKTRPTWRNANSCHPLQPRQVRFHQNLARKGGRYFKERNLSRKGDWRLHLKTTLMIALYFVPWAPITGDWQGPVGGYVAEIIMGLALPASAKRDA